MLVDKLFHQLRVAYSQSAFRPAQHAIMDDHITK